ncbi:MAG: hypothetical protein M0Z66_02550 [Thermaerobacter sp.]|nr:hypothetical protein [Thermaerobacter sp.]
MRRIAFAIGFALVALAGVIWTLRPGDAVRLGVFAGTVVAVVTLAMLFSRRDSVDALGIKGAVRWVRVSFVSRMAVLLLVLLLLRKQLGASGDLAFLGGFFVVEAAMLILLAREKG